MTTRCGRAGWVHTRKVRSLDVHAWARGREAEVLQRGAICGQRVLTECAVDRRAFGSGGDTSSVTRKICLTFTFEHPMRVSDRSKGAIQVAYYSTSPASGGTAAAVHKWGYLDAGYRIGSKSFCCVKSMWLTACARCGSQPSTTCECMGFSLTHAARASHAVPMHATMHPRHALASH